MQNKFFLWKIIDLMQTKKFFRFIYIFSRISMGVTFILSGIRKFPGLRFTILGTDNPVGLYFEAMHKQARHQQLGIKENEMVEMKTGRLT